MSDPERLRAGDIDSPGLRTGRELPARGQRGRRLLASAGAVPGRPVNRPSHVRKNKNPIALGGRGKG